MQIIKDSWYCSPECRPKRTRKGRPTPKTQAELAEMWRAQRSPLRVALEDGTAQEFLDAVAAECNITEQGCWLWQRRLNDGYPYIRIAGRDIYVHRAVLEAKHGAPLGSQAAHHTCATPSCVSPEHLQPVTHRDNVAEMLARQSYLTRIRELEEALAESDPHHPLLGVIAVA